MEDALKKLRDKLNNFLNEALYEEYEKQNGEARKKIDTVKVSMDVFVNFLRYNLLINKAASEEDKKRKWEALTKGIKTKEGEIPLVVMYDGFAIYTDTMEAAREMAGKSMKYYSNSQIATVAV